MLPQKCPSCENILTVKRLSCEKCGTEVEGLYQMPVLASLSSAHQEFIIQFMKASGSLKEMAEIKKLSYPTVRNQLNEIIDAIKEKEK
jgi:hypothetical protein